MELYYYTSTDTIRFVLTKANIYATNIRYMNDSEEYINGLKELYNLANDDDLIEEWIDRENRTEISINDIKRIFTKDNLEECMKIMEFYSISFCKKNDLLSQWAIYAKESGVSVKMKFEKNTYEFSTKGTEENVRAEWNLLPQEVYYFTRDSMNDKLDKYKQIAFTILEQLYEKNSKDREEGIEEKWRFISTFLKRYDFYQEEESRLVFQPNRSAFPPAVQYRQDKKVLKPYLDIECKNGWPIWEIMVGPGFNQQVVCNSMEHFLEHEEVKVGIGSAYEYGQRIKSYFEPHHDELSKGVTYKDLLSQLSDANRNKTMDIEDMQITWCDMVREVIREVEKDVQYSEKLKEYFANHKFTRSGVIISKSSIPYIF